MTYYDEKNPSNENNVANKSGDCQIPAENFYLDLTKTGPEHPQAAHSAQQPEPFPADALSVPQPAAAPSTPTGDDDIWLMPPAAEDDDQAAAFAAENNLESSGLAADDYAYECSWGDDDMLPLADMPSPPRVQIAWDAHSAFAQQPPAWDGQPAAAAQEPQPQAAATGGPVDPQTQRTKQAMMPGLPEQRKQSGRRPSGRQVSARALALTVVMCLLLSSVLGIGGGYLAYQWFGTEEENPAQLADNGEGNGTGLLSTSSLIGNALSGSGYSASQVAEIAADSVVEIITQSQSYSFWGSSGQVMGAGSGVIISSDGYIVTNNHVVDGVNAIGVTLRSGDYYEAQLVDTSSESDVAVLKINATGLSAVSIGDSGQLKVGDPAIVIGNPLGQLGGSVTVGVISALDREIALNGQTMNLLQTDASINSGNSGGGLFNQYGELVGIVVAKGSGVDVEGLGFAIPVNDVLDLIDELIASGDRVMLGVSMLNIADAQTALSYRVETLGVYIARVERNSNAERAGLEAGDRLISVNGQAITDADDIINAVNACEAGDTLTLVYERNGEQQSVSIVMQPIVYEQTAS